MGGFFTSGGSKRANMRLLRYGVIIYSNQVFSTCVEYPTVVFIVTLSVAQIK